MVFEVDLYLVFCRLATYFSHNVLYIFRQSIPCFSGGPQTHWYVLKIDHGDVFGHFVKTDIVNMIDWNLNGFEHTLTESSHRIRPRHRHRVVTPLAVDNHVQWGEADACLHVRHIFRQNDTLCSCSDCAGTAVAGHEEYRFETSFFFDF